MPAQPFTSATDATDATDAIDAFASTTCCAGVTKGEGGIVVHAPYGLEDVVALHMRPNPRRAPREVYEAKVSEYRERWPALTADPWPA